MRVRDFLLPSVADASGKCFPAGAVRNSHNTERRGWDSNRSPRRADSAPSASDPPPATAGRMLLNSPGMDLAAPPSSRFGARGLKAYAGIRGPAD